MSYGKPRPYCLRCGFALVAGRCWRCPALPVGDDDFDESALDDDDPWHCSACGLPLDDHQIELCDDCLEEIGDEWTP